MTAIEVTTRCPLLAAYCPILAVVIVRYMSQYFHVCFLRGRKKALQPAASIINIEPSAGAALPHKACAGVAHDLACFH